ncbi:MAG: phosphate transport system regulatory protein PhoU [Bacteroidetes bacterium]|nr:MAG: phosphate transport system regulatory protein PhoU [Bacteroidota bacterium]
MPAYRHLDEEFETLRGQLDRMMALVESQLSDVADALMACSPEKAEAVIRADREIDELELAVDHQCARIMALQQPVAVDLRRLIMASKMNKDLERIGDECKNIARAVPHICNAADVLEVTTFDQMADRARAMLRKVQDAIHRRDRVLAREVIAEDRHVDRLYDDNFQALVAYGRQHPEHIEAVAHLFTVVKALERIADHIKNIGEDVVFLIDAVDIRHRGVPRAEEGGVA